MNLIKSPRELLFEYAGVPAMAAGGDLAKQFAGQIAKALMQYRRIHGKDPDPADVEATMRYLGIAWGESGEREGTEQIVQMSL